MRNLVTFFVICLILTTPSLARVWTDKKGRRLNAEYIKNSDGIIYLKKDSGKIIKIGLSSLSKADQEHLKKKHSRSNKPEELYPAKSEGKYGYINKRGKIVIAYQYEQARFFSEGLALVYNGGWGFINPDGDPVIGLGKPSPGHKYKDFSEGLAVFYKSFEGAGFIDKQGNVVIKPQFKDANSFSEGLAAVKSKREETRMKFGYIDKKGNMVIAPKYNEALEFSDGLAAVNLEGIYGNWGYLDKKGEWVIKPQFHRAYSFNEGLARAMPKGGGGFGLIDKKGDFIVSTLNQKKKPPTKVNGFQVTISTGAWYTTEEFACGVAPVGFGGEWFLVDGKGKKKVSRTISCSGIDRFHEDMALYQNNKQQYGYIDIKGRIAIVAQYEYAYPFKNGLAMVETKSARMYIDKKGRTVWKTKLR